MLVLHRFQPSHRLHPQSFTTGKTPLHEEVAKVVEVLDAGLGESLCRCFHPTLTPRIEPLVPLGQRKVLTLHLATLYRLHIGTWTMTVEHLNLLAV